MTISISDKPEMNVVNVGDELTEDMIAAINNAATPSAGNPYVTVSAGNSAYVEKDGGGTVVGTVIVDTDGTVGGNTATITGNSVEVNNFGVGTIKVDPVLGITFPDNTSQGTAAVTTPDATTSVKGKVELATDEEAIAGTSTTLAVTPSTVAKEITRRLAQRRFQTPLGNFSVQTLGSNAQFSQVALYANRVTPSAGIVGFARGYGIVNQPDASGLDWAKPLGFSAWGMMSNGLAYSGVSVRIGVGYQSSPTAGVVAGDFTVRGFGFYWLNGGNVFLQVHDGTTLFNIDTGFTPQTSGTTNLIYFEAFSDGTGNVTGKIRSSIGTTGGATTEYTFSSVNGPNSTLAGGNANGFMYQIATNGTHTSAWNSGGLHQTFFYD